MKNELDQVLAKKKSGKPLFMAHCIAGYPTVSGSLAVATALAKSGADVIELQVPFSDPMADGPTITEASQEVVAKGFDTKDAFTLAARLRRKVSAPIVLMTYLNVVFAYGIERFVAQAARAGVSGLIVPDVPFDSSEGKRILRAAKQNNLHFIFVVSPGIPKKRLQLLARHARGFVYATSRQGTTGAHSRFSSHLGGYIRDMKRTFSVPVCLGFGIKTSKDIRAAKDADMVVAGSVFIETMKHTKGSVVSGVAGVMRNLRP